MHRSFPPDESGLRARRYRTHVTNAAPDVGPTQKRNRRVPANQKVHVTQPPSYNDFPHTFSCRASSTRIWPGAW